MNNGLLRERWWLPSHAAFRATCESASAALRAHMQVCGAVLPSGPGAEAGACHRWHMAQPRRTHGRIRGPRAARRPWPPCLPWHSRARGHMLVVPQARAMSAQQQPSCPQSCGLASHRVAWPHRRLDAWGGPAGPVKAATSSPQLPSTLERAVELPSSQRRAVGWAAGASARRRAWWRTWRAPAPACACAGALSPACSSTPRRPAPTPRPRPPPHTPAAPRALQGEQGPVRAPAGVWPMLAIRSKHCRSSAGTPVQAVPSQGDPREHARRPKGACKARLLCAAPHLQGHQLGALGALAAGEERAAAVGQPRIVGPEAAAGYALVAKLQRDLQALAGRDAGTLCFPARRCHDACCTNRLLPVRPVRWLTTKKHSLAVAHWTLAPHSKATQQQAVQSVRCMMPPC